jgi:hypothetical protein
MNAIEERQCRSCFFSKLNDHDENRHHAEEFPMCYEIEGLLISADTIEALDNRGGSGVVCTKYKDAALTNELIEQSHPDQHRLF